MRAHGGSITCWWLARAHALAQPRFYGAKKRNKNAMKTSLRAVCAVRSARKKFNSDLISIPRACAHALCLCTVTFNVNCNSDKCQNNAIYCDRSNPQRRGAPVLCCYTCALRWCHVCVYTRNAGHANWCRSLLFISACRGLCVALSRAHASIWLQGRGAEEIVHTLLAAVIYYRVRHKRIKCTRCAAVRSHTHTHRRDSVAYHIHFNPLQVESWRGTRSSHLLIIKSRPGTRDRIQMVARGPVQVAAAQAENQNVYTC